jgi:hypothetical protein
MAMSDSLEPNLWIGLFHFDNSRYVLHDVLLLNVLTWIPFAELSKTMTNFPGVDHECAECGGAETDYNIYSMER